MTRLQADFLLLLTALIWGTAFVAQKSGNAVIGPLTFVGIRFFLSGIVMLPLIRREARKSLPAMTRQDLGLAVLIGLCLFSGASLQQLGMVTTSATNGGFLTALYVAFVPFLVWIIDRRRPRATVLLAVVISLTGAWLLAGGAPLGFAIGDLYVVLADIAWALAIALVPIFLHRTHRPFFLSFAQYFITAALGLACGLWLEPQSWQGLVAAAPAILYAGLISGGIAYTLQIVGQKHAPPAEAALILSLESVFAALAGAVLLDERLSLTAQLGCGLILAGVVLAEIGPGLWNALPRRQKNEVA